MYFVFLRLTDKSKVADNMAAHNTWLRRGFDEGVFMLAGTIEPKQGGAILAVGMSQSQLQTRLEADPFVKNGVVSVDIIEVTPAMTDTRLEFLKR